MSVTVLCLCPGYNVASNIYVARSADNEYACFTFYHFMKSILLWITYNSTYRCSMNKGL